MEEDKKIVLQEEEDASSDDSYDSDHSDDSYESYESYDSDDSDHSYDSNPTPSPFAIDDFELEDVERRDFRRTPQPSSPSGANKGDNGRPHWLSDEELKIMTDYLNELRKHYTVKRLV